MDKRQSLQQAVMGKLDSYMQKNKIRTTNNMHKIKLNFIKDVNIRSDAIKLLKRENLEARALFDKFQ